MIPDDIREFNSSEEIAGPGATGYSGWFAITCTTQDLCGYHPRCNLLFLSDRHCFTFVVTNPGISFNRLTTVPG